MERSLLYPAETRTRRAVSLDGIWRFRFDTEGRGLEDGWQNGLPESMAMPVPSSFADLFTDKDSREYCGDFWYEREFFVPEEWRGREIVLRFGAVAHRARVFVNGVETGGHVGGFLPFETAVGEAVRWGESNRLCVLANNELSEVTLPCGKTGTRPDGRKFAQPYFDFFNYAGVQRPVKLLALPRERILDYDVVCRLGANETAFVDYAVTARGEHAVSVSLLDGEGRTVAESQGAQGTLTVENARLWRVRDAYLYRIVLRLTDGETVLDEYTDRIGIRSFEIRESKFLLNGEPVYLKGFGRHEDSDIRGRGLDLPTVKRDFELMKWAGANCFRTSHYPYAEELYCLADEEGFLIIDEVPAVGMFESLMNAVDAAGGAKEQRHWFEKETTPQLLEHHKACVSEMIQRDKNHPSVIAWSLFNEPETTHESAVPYFEEVFALARELDPQKRPCTFALIGGSTPETCKCWQLSDFLSLNRYYGWYLLNGYQAPMAEAALRAELEGWGTLRGERPVIFTEYGADTDAGLHKLPSVMWSQEYQEEFLELCHRVFDSFAFVQGELVWNFADFQTAEGIIRLDGNKKGVFTRQRQPKDAAYLLRRRWQAI